MYVPDIKKTYSCRNVFRIFMNFRQDIRKRSFYVHFDVISSKILSWHNPTDPPPFRSVLLLLQTTRGWEKSCQAVVCSGASQNSVQFPVPGYAECQSGGFSVRPALLLFPKTAPHRSGQIPETIALYYTFSKYRGRCV
jgi:hypothetical protein